MDSITHDPPGNQERTELHMKNLIETAKATKVPEKYELRVSDIWMPCTVKPMGMCSGWFLGRSRLASIRGRRRVIADAH